MPLISIVIPVYNEEENIPMLYQRLDNISGRSEHTFEFIFVDDGSSDNSFRLIQELSAKDDRVKIIKFSRNFGSHAGCLAGLMHSQGDASAFLSADLQEPPELILRLIEQWENGHEVVIGKREEKGDSTGIFQKFYYILVRKYALKNMPEKGTDVFLIDKKVVSAVTDMKEKNTSIFGLILWSGFRQAFVPYKRETRLKGTSKWSIAKKIKLFIDTFVSFSYFPIRIISFGGIIIAFTGFIYALVIVTNRLFFLKGTEGWSYVMAALLIIAGIQFLMLGILGEYIWRNFEESRNRHIFIIDKKIGFGTDKN
ncbi:MAG: glycosyltransferase family 2 protein [Thermodesulfovibrionia bacterium]|nr:glycosyltransferase family 2 protein [Thermodesulfovibrionia bacterium]